MTNPTLRNAIETLLNEIWDGPPNPNGTWVVSNEPRSGILGTLHDVHADESRIVPDGLCHSIAEHVAHLHFSIEQAAAHLRGETPGGDWTSSWNAGEPGECGWQSMQRSLREAELRLRLSIHNLQDFDHFERTCGILATIAHAAYHLGAIRQMAAMLKAKRSHAEPTLPSPITAEA